MATAKFKDVSPYKKSQRLVPTQDYLYQKFTWGNFIKPIINLLLTGYNEIFRHIRKIAPVVMTIFFLMKFFKSTIHLSNIVNNPRVKLIYIVDDYENNWIKLKDYWHLEDVIFLNSKQADKVYNDTNIDAVVVATPTYTHEVIVSRALEGKKAVFCEKPIAEDNADSLKCYDTARKVGKPLFCAFNRRFDPSYAAVRERVRSGEIGHVHVIKTVSRDSPLPSIDYLKISGGIFHDCMVHDFDIITWILGEYPVKVAAQACAHIPEIKAIDDYDTVLVSLYFPSGTLGMVDVSRNSPYGYDQRLEVFGPKGMIVANNESANSVNSQNGVQGITSAPIWYSFASRFMNGYRRELDHFINVVLGKTEPSVLPKEILAVSKIATACEESVRTGKMVEINWTPNELP